VDGTFGVILGVLYPVDHGCFERLVLLSEFLDAFVIHIFNRGESLRVAGLAGALRPYLAGIISEFVGLRLVASGVSLAFPGSWHVIPPTVRCETKKLCHSAS
jgi:hypothetical protein